MPYTKFSGPVFFVLAIAISSFACTAPEKNITSGEFQIGISSHLENFGSGSLDLFNSLYPKTKGKAIIEEDGTLLKMMLAEELDAIMIRMDLGEAVNKKARWDTRLIAYSAPVFFTERKEQHCDSCLNISKGTYEIATIDPTMAALWNDSLVDAEWEVHDSIVFSSDSCGISCWDYSFMRTSIGPKEYGIPMPLCDSTNLPVVASQSTIQDKSYPMSHGIYILLRTPGSNPQTGFVSYLLGDSGQRMMLKEGLVPVQMPVREVNVVR